jgi:cyclase
MSKARGFTTVSALLGCALALPSFAADVVDLDQFGERFGWDFETAEITVETLDEGFHVLFGIGGNIAVSVGTNGTLLVDDQFPRMMGRIDEALASVGSDGIDFVVNTHWHFDHAEGNLTLGPRGAWLVAHSNSRAMMADEHLIDLVAVKYRQQAYPEAAWPVITYDDGMQFHFNGERIDLLHAGPAHTTGDTAVIFRKRNAVHLGDVFNNTGYPFIDAGNGGSIDGVIEFCSAVLRELDQDSIVIPGHGPISDYRGLADYIQMLRVVRERIASLIARGSTLEDVMAAKPTADFDERYGDPAMLIDRAYASLSR